MLPLYKFQVLLGIIILLQVFVITAFSQDTKELGTELTEKYAKTLDLNMPNPTVMEGRDVWLFSLDAEMSSSTLKRKMTEVTSGLDVQIMAEWEEQQDGFLHGYIYDGYIFALFYQPEANLLLSSIEKTGQDQSSTGSTPEQWETLRTFEGSGTKNTSAFTVESDEWKIVYEAESSNPELGGAGSILQVYLLEPGQEVWQGQILINEANQANVEGESHVYESGRFYFKSKSANMNWNIEVRVPK